MVFQVINKKVDIYQYPQEIAGNSGSVWIGDLHGNAVKLLYFLLYHNVLKFKDSVENPAVAYQYFVKTYEAYGEGLSSFLKKKLDIQIEETKIKHTNAKISRYNRLKDTNPRSEAQENKFSNFNLEQASIDLEKTTTNKKNFAQELEKSNQSLHTLFDYFNQFLDQLEIADKEALVGFIGDVFGDWGANDYFTLKFIELLKNGDINISTLISNHDYEFIHAYEYLENNKGFIPADNIVDKSTFSLKGLKFLLDKNLVSKAELSKLVSFAYKPSLKVLDYTLNEAGINLHTHAPVRFDLIRQIANQLGVFYNDSTKEALAATIDKINTKFSQIVQQNRVHKYCHSEDIAKIEHMTRKRLPKIL